MKRILSISFFIILPLILGALYISPSKTPKVFAATATHLVISEIQIGKTGTSTDEFVELYNPTSSSVDLSGWKIGRKTQSGANAADLASLSGTIPAHGFFLVASANYSGAPSADITYATASGSIANDNTLILKNSGATIIDLVGMGSAVASETATAANPSTNKSIERKANSLSTINSMKIGGADEFAGNGEDTDSNTSDFVNRDLPQPQNSNSPIEPVAATPTDSLTPTETPTQTPTPTLTGTPTPTPTGTLTPTPTETLTPTPTSTLTPTPTVSPTLTPTPTPSGGNVILRTQNVVCTLTYRTIHVLFVNFRFPVITCTRI